MTTKTIDTTVPNSLQDNSSIEYVDSQENPIVTIQTEPKNLASANQLFDFDAEHNGEACIESLRPEDRGTEHQFWFTRQMLAKCFDIHRDSVTNHVEALVKRGVLEVTKNFVTSEIPTNSGIQQTTLYDLKVFNYLVMRLDTDQAWEKKAKTGKSHTAIFRSMRSPAETTGLTKQLSTISRF